MTNIMKNSILLTICTILLQAGSLCGQADTIPSKFGTYFIDGDDVVFEFDRRSYEQALRSSDSLRVDFADLKIKKVTISGGFNEWSGEGWKMKRVDENRFQLRKPLKMFTDAPNWQFRYVINGTYWTPTDSVFIREGILGWYNLTNPDMTGPALCDTGNVLFHLEGFTDRKKVILTGSFNNWNEEVLEMKKSRLGWDARIALQPGIYEYKFIADGQWMEDPANPEKRVNQYATFNSVLRVNQPVVFMLKGFQNAQEVILTGSFASWDPKAFSMQKTADGWIKEISLTGGKHLYKFIADGQWMTDPDNRRMETDKEGNKNSVLFIR